MGFASSVIQNQQDQIYKATHGGQDQNTGRQDAGTLARVGTQGLGDIFNSTQGTQSKFSGLDNIGSVKSKYGLNPEDIDSIYAPLRQILEANKGRNLASASSRLGRSAQPGKTFGSIESNALDANAQLASQEGKSKNDVNAMAAQLLQNAMGQQDQFGFNKSNSLANLLTQRFGIANADQQRMDAEPGAGDYIMSFLGGGLKSAGSALGSLFGGAAGGVAADKTRGA